ncbi:MAG: exopolysaccharide biosynthesis polyprenyl glycosylphosphotransferase [bacterium]|nr:exopolysaccharide biosynthesis polyprenyl glycosylphosphotransferase [bacterium]
MRRLTLTEQFLKRLMDIVVSVLVLSLSSPILFLIALLIKLDSKGEIFYKDVRIGKGGKPYTTYKFRSMVKDATKMGLGYRMMKDDPRITRVGKWLRRFSLDELPQLFNVLKGDMSLIGPRPGLPFQVEQYSDFQRRRLEVKPGITGLAQISGRNLLSWKERIEKDIEYIDNYSFLLDLKILLRTPKVVLSKEGIYSDYQQEEFL